MKKHIRLYNVIFPVWMLILFPITWIVVLPANFIMDSIVVIAALKLMGEKEIWRIYKKVILFVWGLGFLSDIIGCALLFTSQIGYSGIWYEYIQGPVAYNPLDNLFSLLYVLITVAAAGVLIYFLNMRYSFRKADLEKRKRHVISLALAIITAPYLFLIPLSVFMDGPGAFDKSEIFTNHIVPGSYTSMSISSNEEGSGINWGNEEKEYYYSIYQLSQSINKSGRLWKKEAAPSRDADYTLEFFDSVREKEKNNKTVYLWIEGEDVYYRYKDSFYRARRKDVSEIKKVLHGIETGEFAHDREIIYREDAQAQEN